MRGRFSSFPLAGPAALALLVLLLAAVIVVAGRTGSDSRGPLPGSGSAPSGNLIDWKLFGRVPQRLHYLPSDIKPPLKQVWAYNDQALIEFPPAIADGRLFVVNKYSNVRALDAATGKVVWDLRRDRHYKGPASDVTAPVFGREQVFAAFEDGALTERQERQDRVEARAPQHPSVITAGDRQDAVHRLR